MKQVELNWTKCGQYYPYGDFYRICEIHTKDELTESEILLLCKNQGKLPKAKWQIEQMKSADIYFRGYYTIEKTNYGYKYIGVEPYDD